MFVRVIALGLALLTVFIGVTIVALEGSEVAAIRTRDLSGDWRTTRVWVAEDEGMPLIEAASTRREFYRDLLRNPKVQLEQPEGVRRKYLARPLPPAAGHALVRQKLRERYGWRDWWIGWLADTSSSIAIRLEPSDSD